MSGKCSPTTRLSGEGANLSEELPKTEMDSKVWRYKSAEKLRSRMIEDSAYDVQYVQLFPGRGRGRGAARHLLV